jgi:hypothetical protein
VEIGSTETPHWWAADVEVAGGLAYVADGDYGLRVIDVSNPTLPVEVGALDTPGEPNSVELVGDLVYLVDYGYGLRVIDVSNPALPVEIGSIDTPQYPQDVEVVGDLAYLAAGYMSGLRVIDVSNPALPVEFGALDTVGIAVDIAVVGDLAYLADYQSGLRVIDVSNPAIPMEIGAIAPPNDAVEVEVVGNLAYLALLGYGGPYDLRIIDFGPEYFARQCGGPEFIELNVNSGLMRQTVCIDSLNSYWFPVVAGESYPVRVATINGDPDLYGSTVQACIESLPTPGGGCSYESSTATGPAAEEIQFTAAATGAYYIGVYGVTDATYQIEVPEPSRWLLLVAGTAFLGLLYRRHARGLRIG